MEAMDGWDLALLIIAAYVAAKALVKLMIRRRDQMVDEFRGEVQREQIRRKEAARAAAGFPRRSKAA